MEPMSEERLREIEERRAKWSDSKAVEAADGRTAQLIAVDLADVLAEVRRLRIDLEEANRATRLALAERDEAQKELGIEQAQDTDEAHRILSAAGIADGELSERVEDLAGELEAANERLAQSKLFVLDDGTTIAQQPGDRLWYVTRCHGQEHQVLTVWAVWVPFARNPPPESAFEDADTAFAAFAAAPVKP